MSGKKLEPVKQGMWSIDTHLRLSKEERADLCQTPPKARIMEYQGKRRPKKFDSGGKEPSSENVH